jgi:hypothetical protein
MLVTSQLGYDYTTDVKSSIILGENRTQCVWQHEVIESRTTDTVM